MKIRAKIYLKNFVGRKRLMRKTNFGKKQKKVNVKKKKENMQGFYCNLDYENFYFEEP